MKGTNPILLRQFDGHCSIPNVFNLCISKFKEFNVLHGGPLNPKSDKIVSREFPLKLNVFLGGSLILKWEKMLSCEFLRN